MPRRGFTLVEMLVSVTLVLMMMLMFAEIYSLAQQTISTQKGIAENDQKARILVEVIRRDLDTRTFRSVYPFKLEPVADFAITEDQVDLLGKRQGYFSISENDPEDPTDDVLQLTVEVDQDVYGGAGDRVYGRAGAALAAPKDAMRSLPTPPAAPAVGMTPAVPLETEQNHPEYDDGVFGNTAGSSDTAEISYFLRGGNLYRSVLLIRKPYITDAAPQPPIDPNWGGADPYENYTLFSTQYPPNPNDYPNASAPPNPPRSVWNDFDFSVYREPIDPALATFEWRFHGRDGLPNDEDATEYRFVGAKRLFVPRSLGVPYLRFGHEVDVLGRPMEYSGGQFFGRFTIAERSSPLFAYPGSGWAPFDGTAGPGAYASSTARRGVDLMLSNVHGFDIQVWDDIVGDYVNLGHSLQGRNPYVIDASGNHPVQDGFYHASRRRDPFPQAMLAPGEDNHYDDPSVEDNFGNRYDTWSPRMFLEDAMGRQWRTGRAPYRPQWTNPDPNTGTFNDPPPPTEPLIPTSLPSVTRESRMAFGDSTVDDDGDGLTVHPRPGQPNPDPEDTDAEAPLRAVRLVVRYLDSHSGQMRQATIETSLID